jgi:hypothetical protein
MEFLIIGMATAMNVLIIKWKLEKKRYEDAGFDAAILVLLSLVFSGTYGGLVVATIASAIISLYLIASPPKFAIGSLKDILSDKIDGKPV